MVDSIVQDLLGVGIILTVLLLLYARNRRESIGEVLKDLMSKLR